MTNLGVKNIFILIILIFFSCSKESGEELFNPVKATPEDQEEIKEEVIEQFTLSVTAGRGGIVNTLGGTYDEGTEITLIATSEPEYVFSVWSGSEVSSENPFVFNIQNDEEISATFVKKQYALTVNIDGEGAVNEEVISAGKLADYDSGTVVRLTAVPSDLWTFVGWTGAIESTEAVVELTITEAKEVSAVFIKEQYPLTINIEGEGSVTEEVISSGKLEDYESGTVIRLTAVPDSQWQFVGWSGSIESTNSVVELTMTEAKEVSAFFIRKQYPLTINIVGKGSVTEEVINTGKLQDYDSDTVVRLTAVPDNEWDFVGWTGEILSANPVIELTMTEAKEISAFFVKKQYPLTINIEGEGTVTEEIISTGKIQDYDSGSVVRLTAVPANQWKFVGWTGAIESTNPVIELTMTEAKEVSALFVKIRYPLTVNIEGEGTVIEEIINGGKLQDYDSGSVVRLTAAPSNDWEFVGWTGAVESTDPVIELTMTEAKEVTAVFTKIRYPLTIDIEGSGTVLTQEVKVDTDKLKAYDAGTVVRLTAVPETGWVFDGWTGAVVSNESDIEITMDSSKKVSALFKLSSVTF